MSLWHDVCSFKKSLQIIHLMLNQCFAEYLLFCRHFGNSKITGTLPLSLFQSPSLQELYVFPVVSISDRPSSTLSPSSNITLSWKCWIRFNLRHLIRHLWSALQNLQTEDGRVFPEENEMAAALPLRTLYGPSSSPHPTFLWLLQYLLVEVYILLSMNFFLLAHW